MVCLWPCLIVQLVLLAVLDQMNLVLLIVNLHISLKSLIKEGNMIEFPIGGKEVWILCIFPRSSFYFVVQTKISIVIVNAAFIK